MLFPAKQSGANVYVPIWVIVVVVLALLFGTKAGRKATAEMRENLVVGGYLLLLVLVPLLVVGGVGYAIYGLATGNQLVFNVVAILAGPVVLFLAVYLIAFAIVKVRTLIARIRDEAELPKWVHDFENGKFFSDSEPKDKAS